MRKIIQYLLLSTPLVSQAQFEPRVGEVGSTALKSDNSAFKAWATSCKLVRGYQNIANPTAGFASAGDENSPVGNPSLSNGVASFGDGGSAILTFSQPIANGDGFDFAVFENGFKEIGGTFDFLEYAFVEVSSEGVRFFRFSAQHAGDVSTQVASFQPTDTRLYHNLAGKYTAGYGTPFDLEELKDSAGLDVNNITHVKIVDVVGSIETAYATHDSQGNIVNDPWPTEFPASGFDLDAVGVINVESPAGIKNNVLPFGTKVFPNPANGFIEVTSQSNQSLDAVLTDLFGRVLKSWNKVENQRLDISFANSGTYLLHFKTANTSFTQKLTVE
jgi:hypothetical protein